VTKHRAPWDSPPPPRLDEDVWELYSPEDWTQAHNIALENPRKLVDLQRLWLMEAARFNVLPLDDRFVERVDPDLAGRPKLARGKTQVLFGGMGRLSEWTVISVKNKSHSITAEIVAPDAGSEGVIVAQGGRFGGWSLYALRGRLKYTYNYFGIEHFSAESLEQIPPGRHEVRMVFDYDGGGVGKGGSISLHLDGEKIGEGRIDRTVPVAFSIDETCDIGMESGSPVSEDYAGNGNKFTGDVSWVRFDVNGVDDDALVPAEARYSAAMVRQ
jgi:arylsulfatase